MDKRDGLSEFDGTVADMSESPNETEQPHHTPALQVTEPIDVVAAVRAAAAPKPAHRPWGWWTLAAVGVFVSAILAAGLVAAVGDSAGNNSQGAASTRPLVATHRPAPTTSGRAGATASVAPAEWPSVVAALDDARAAAFARADESMVVAFDLPQSAAYSADLATVRAMKAHGVRADGFVLDVAAVQVRTATEQSAQLLVTDSRPGFEWRRQNNTVVARVPARPRARWMVDLTRGGALGWQVVSVQAASPAGPRPTSPQLSGR